MQSSDAPSITGKDRAAVEAVVRDYILANPEIIPQAIQALRSKRALESIAAERTAIETPYKGAWEGAAQPKVTIVEFFDYACGYCRAALPDLARLVKENPDLRIVYRELPILSDDSVKAARVSLLAAEQGRYMPFHEALYGAGRVSEDSILASAMKAGLDKAQARAAMTSDSRDAEITNNVRLAQQMQGEGTPMFLVGDQMFFGAVGYDALAKAVVAARTR